MGPTDENGELSVESAVATIERAQGFVEPLRRRTEGMTWFLWGVATFGAGAMGAITPDSISNWDAGGWRRVVDSTAWVPWLIFGLLGTRALTRIANVHLRGRDGRIAWGAKGTVGLVLGVLAIWALFMFLPSGLEAGWAILFIGTIWLVLGGLDPFGATPEGRRMMILIGLGIIAGALVFYLVTRDPDVHSWDHLALGLGLTGGFIPMIGGLVQTLRG